MREELFEESAGNISVERKVTLLADPDLVWQHLTEGDLVADWMGEDVEIELRPGGSIVMTPDEGHRVWGTIEEIVPGRRLQWSWRTDDGLPTQVEIDLEPAEDGTALTVRETLLPWTITGLPPQWGGSPFPEAFLSVAA
ncbi:MAG TPA: SRPBCC domain-containing protein [Acidimicrobiia bacterium]|nr:SRPBCC domain-containing protein [Acidimicrobiia bacterium]